MWSVAAPQRYLPKNHKEILRDSLSIKEEPEFERYGTRDLSSSKIIYFKINVVDNYNRIFVIYRIVSNDNMLVVIDRSSITDIYSIDKKIETDLWIDLLQGNPFLFFHDRVKIWDHFSCRSKLSFMKMNPDSSYGILVLKNKIWIEERYANCRNIFQDVSLQSLLKNLRKLISRITNFFERVGK